MALTTPSLLTNILASLDRHLDGLSAAGLPVHAHGIVRYVPPASGTWIQADYSLIGMTRQHYRQMESGTVGDELQGTITLNLFEHRRVYADRITFASARDTVVAHFPTGGLIPVLDFADENETQVGSVCLGGLTENYVNNAAVQELAQYAVSVDVRYLEAYSAPA